MEPLPILLNLKGRRVLVVGGGAVAKRRAKAMVAAGAEVTAVAPEFAEGWHNLHAEQHTRGFAPEDLDGVDLVVIATDRTQVNQDVADLARERGVWCNRADAPDQGDFVVPAHRTQGQLTLAVSTHGVSANAAASIRDGLWDALDPDWLTLLDAVAERRAKLRLLTDDSTERQRRLRAMVHDDARRVLREQGPEALNQYLDQCLSGPTPQGPKAT